MSRLSLFGVIIFITIIIIYFVARRLRSFVANPLGLKDSYVRDAGSQMICPTDKVNEAGLCYNKPLPDYNCLASSCTKKCPQGWTGTETVAHCTKDTYTRGSGTALDSCPEGMEKDGGLCYTKCKDGYEGVGPVCWKTCPAGYKNTGATCLRSADTIAQDRYKRNDAGRIPDFEKCKSGYTQFPLTCTRCTTVDKGYYNYSWGCGTSIAKCHDGSIGCKNDCYRSWIVNLQTECDTYSRKTECAADEELIDGLCYKKCRDGYSSHRGDILYCTKDGCPHDYTDTGLTCYRAPHTIGRDSYGRASGTSLICGPNKEKDGGLCYTKCKDGYEGAGPVCWKTCPTGYKNIGASCEKPRYDRGIGKVPDQCPEGKEKDGAFCYSKCKDGYHGVGPVCWEQIDDSMSQVESFTV